jgi:hypothetical protein
MHEEPQEPADAGEVPNPHRMTDKSGEKEPYVSLSAWGFTYSLHSLLYAFFLFFPFFVKKKKKNK